jgi:hypothetical protein
MAGLEKTRHKPTVFRNSSFSPVRFDEQLSRNIGIFGVFRTKIRGFSLQSRLCGGERGIRTLDTGVSPYNGLARHFDPKI